MLRKRMRKILGSSCRLPKYKASPLGEALYVYTDPGEVVRHPWTWGRA